MVNTVDAGAPKTRGGPGRVSGSRADSNLGSQGKTNPKAWKAAEHSAQPFLPKRAEVNGPVKSPTEPVTPNSATKPPNGGVKFQGGAGVGTSTTTPVPDARPVAPTLKAPYDPSGELNRLKGDGDTATFAITAGAKVAVPTPWTGPVAVGPQVQAGYGVTVKQVGGGGPGQPATAEPPQYAVTFDKNQLAGVYGNTQISGGNSSTSNNDLFGKGSLELNLTHADRVTMTFGNKEDAARSIRILQGQAEAQAVRDTKTVVSPSITIPDPVAAVQDVAGRAVQDPLGTALDVLNPFNRAKAVYETGKTVVNGVVQDVNSVLGNPLKGENGNGAPPPGTIEVPLRGPVATVLGYGADALAEQLQPSPEDQAFLQSHVTGYEEAVGAQERLTAELKLGSMLSIDGRLAANQTLTRAVTLPTAPAPDGTGGKPGTVSYEYRQGLDLSGREKLKFEDQLKKIGVTVPKVGADKVNDALELNTTTTLGQVNLSAKLTYEMTPAQSDALRQSKGANVPGLLQLGEPKSLDVTLQGRVMVPNPGTVFGPGIPPADNLYGNFKLQSSLANPGDTLGAAKDQLLSNGVPGAVELLAKNSTVTGEVTLSKQEGGNISIEPGLSIKKGALGGAEAKLSLAGTAQTDTILARAKGELSWEEPAVVPPPAVPVQPTPTTPTPTPASQPYQVTVIPHDGLNIRAEPGMDAEVLGPAYSGTFLQATGQTRTDTDGKQWLEVSGPDMFRTEQKGWVSAQYVERHPEGEMADGSGRINQLRQDGYVPIQVQPGDTVSGIALKNGVDPSKAVTVNGGHVIDVNLIFPGDTVYIPGR